MSIYAYTNQELHAKCHQLYEYREGHLVSKRTGKPVGHWPSGKDYLITTFVMHPKRFKVLVHRLIFLMHHGYLPEMVDHINGDKTDNRIENLRAATRAQNTVNTGPRNVLREKGVYKTPRGNFQASISYSGKYLHLGVFSTIEEAAAAYQQAAEALHGEFAYHKRGEALTGANS